MSIRNLGILLLKLWGLMCLVWGAIAVVQMALTRVVPMPAEPDAQRYVWMAGLFGTLINLALGAILLTSAHRIVGLIAPPESSDTGGTSGYSLAELQTLLFGAVGAFLAINALRDIAQLTYSIVRRPEWDTTGTFTHLVTQNQQELAGALVQLILAIVLLVSRRALASAWTRVHPMGET